MEITYIHNTWLVYHIYIKKKIYYYST